MDGLQHIGKLLVATGLIIALVGLVLLFSGRLSWFGKLPGDIVVQRRNFTFYFPLATSVIISLLLTLIFWVLGRK